MREILFRGKTKETGEWKYGFVAKHKYYSETEGVFVIEDEEGYWASVIPETIGQFTGLTDKNGVKIFEGDIIKRTIHCSYRNDGMAYDVLFQVPGIQELYGNKIEKDDANNSVDLWETSFEVIGNIHDNPELLI